MLLEVCSPSFIEEQYVCALALCYNSSINLVLRRYSLIRIGYLSCDINARNVL